MSGQGEIEQAMSLLRICQPSTSATVRAAPGSTGRYRAVFLDRDGVLCGDDADRTDPGSLSMIEGADQAVRGFKEMGFLRIVVTNQGGIAMGAFTLDDMISFTREMWRALNGGSPPWEAYYFCPYHVDGVLRPYSIDSIERKPGPGMLLRAALENDVDLPGSYMIGDHLKDIIAAHRAGCKGILVTTGRGKREMERIVLEDIREGDEAYPDAVVEDIKAACALIGEWER